MLANINSSAEVVEAVNMEAEGVGLYRTEMELLAAVDRLVEDPALAERLGRAGRERIASEYDSDRLAERYEAILEQ